MVRWEMWTLVIMGLASELAAGEVAMVLDESIIYGPLALII